MTAEAADAELLEQAAREAGRIALRYFHAGETRQWDKRPGDPVSEADLAVDKCLRQRLMGARPDYGWLSEESADDGSRRVKARAWVVDPIDGTRSFLSGVPEFCVSAALIAEGRPRLGVVFNPATDEFFAGRAGHGARLNGHKIKASARKGLAGARLLASHRTFERHGWLSAAPGAEFHRLGSVAYRMALVAAGRYDAAVSLSEKSDWDIAAAHVLVVEAGGKVADATGAEIRYDTPRARHASVIAAAPGLFAPLMALSQRG